MRIMGRVMLEADRRGYRVQAYRDGRRSVTIMEVSGEQIEFSMTEQIHQERNPVLDGSLLSSEPQYLYTHTGVLSMEINSYGDEGQRRRWRDTKRHRLEDCIVAFLAGVENTAAVCKRRKAEWKRKREQEREEERAAEASVEAQRRERKRFDDLIAEAKAWKTSLLIREYVEAMRAAINENGQDTTPGSKFDTWAEWAEKKAKKVEFPLEFSEKGD